MTQKGARTRPAGWRGRRQPVALVAAVAASIAGLAAPGTSAAGPVLAAGDHVVTLVSGDKVTLRGQDLTVRPGRGRAGIRFQQTTLAGHRYVIPSDAAGLIAKGLVDRRLFDVTQLIAWRYGDRHRGEVPIIVERAAGRRSIAVTGVRVRHSSQELGFDAAEVSKDQAAQAWRALLRPEVQGGITRLWLDGKRKATLDRSVRQIGAAAAWRKGVTGKGMTGKGVTVAVLDTGYDPGHPDLRGVVTQARGFTDRGAGDVRDRLGHGTHVTSIVAGSGRAASGRYQGVAPGAEVVSGKVLDDEGNGADSWILAGMEWATLRARAKIVNLSLGAQDAPGIDPVERAVNTLTARTGALFVIAAGNSGPAARTVDSPGSASAALTVGAVDQAGRPARFSGRGPGLTDAARKPDLTAPGVNITAAQAAGSRLGIPAGFRYQRLSGTSMASPYISGAAAILARRHPGWPAGRIKAALVGTARPARGVSVFAQGSGRVDVARAVAWDSRWIV